MNTVNTSHAHGTQANRPNRPATTQGSASAPAGAAAEGPADAFSQLMQSLAPQADATGDEDTGVAGEELQAGDSDTGNAPSLPAGLPVVTALVDTALPLEGSTAVSAGPVEAGSDTAQPAKAAGRGLAWARPGDGQAAAFPATGQGDPGHPVPPGVASQAGAGGAPGILPGAAPASPPGQSSASPQAHAFGNAMLAARGGADPSSSPAPASLLAQAIASLAEERQAPSIAAAAPLAPAALPAFDPAGIASPPSAQAAAPVHQSEMHARPHEAGFASELAAQVDVMVQGDLQQAELRLNPVDLGPIRIELRVDGNTANVSFTAAHDLTREGISRSLEQLREMLASQGLSLGQADVGARHAGRDSQDGSQAARQPRGVNATGEGAGQAVAAPPRARALRGMLDLYA